MARKRRRIVRCKSRREEATFRKIDSQFVWMRCLPCATGGSFSTDPEIGDSERMQELKRIAIEKTSDQLPLGGHVFRDGTFNSSVPFDPFYHFFID